MVGSIGMARWMVFGGVLTLTGCVGGTQPSVPEAEEAAPPMAGHDFCPSTTADIYESCGGCTPAIANLANAIATTRLHEKDQLKVKQCLSGKVGVSVAEYPIFKAELEGCVSKEVTPHDGTRSAILAAFSRAAEPSRRQVEVWDECYAERLAEKKVACSAECDEGACRLDEDGNTYCAQCTFPEGTFAASIGQHQGAPAKCFGMRPNAEVDVVGTGRISVPDDFWIEAMLSVTGSDCVNGQTRPSCWFGDALRTNPHPTHSMFNKGIVPASGAVEVLLHSFRCLSNGQPSQCNVSSYSVTVVDGALLNTGHKLRWPDVL